MSGYLNELSGVDDFQNWLVKQRKDAFGIKDEQSVKNFGSSSEITRALDAKSISPVSGQIDLSSSPVDKKKAMESILASLKKVGITNPYVQAGVLGVCHKEGGFNIQGGEMSYKNTPATRIREVFGKRVRGLSNSEIDTLKKNDVAFWDRVYGVDDPTGMGKRLGNTSPGDGLKYRGRGYNGITFKTGYQKYTDMLKKMNPPTNVDLVANPDILEKDLQVAADVAALYFLEGLNNPIIKRKYRNKDHNDFKDLKTATEAVSNANAGPGNNVYAGIIGDGTRKAIAFAQNLDLGNLSKTA